MLKCRSTQISINNKEKKRNLKTSRKSLIRQDGKNYPRKIKSDKNK